MSENNGFFDKFKNLWQDFKSDYQTTYRLIEIKHQGSEKYALIGLRFSHMVFKKKLEKAVADDELLAGLSVQDARSLSLYSMFCHMQDKFELIDIELADPKQVYFDIRDKKNSQSIKMTYEELCLRPDIINQFKREELLKIGFICGSSQSQKKK
ncbi:hypothetical protein D5R81_11710 [Parashewanella spongiae]|uniref:Uncharacterized protein n=1 Tax=Parashewanella spongiae TaxID=342950 RepID=A0A3A6TNZ3_9GAMM|nr:hypothetical protein [Parashewanella spongiae]MCL1077595.1 hypothetical protein [Parashewanella spongiae]RJY13177.1 hypothetical protein D5R81_11710 [Parashewanella spongiae]